LFPSEKRSLTRFLIIYMFSTLFLISIGIAIFYRYDYHRLSDYQNEKLKTQTQNLIPKLRELHKSFDEVLYYPVQKGLNSAIYDIDKNYLVGDLKPSPYFKDKMDKNEEFWRDGDYIYYLTKVYPHYLGAAYLISRAKFDPSPINELREKLALFFLLSAIFVFFIAYLLGKLFLFPMKSALSMLDDFIKDTAHELNTPVSVILANTELLKEFYPNLQTSEELSRIEIASKRLSRIYDDLTFLKLNHKRHRNVKEIDLSSLAKERAAYFEIMAKARRIELKAKIKEGVFLRMDFEDAAKLMDNLISNALKYTKPQGEVEIILDEKFLIVKDNGIGIESRYKKFVLRRFFRANDSEGGFGLGLSIVKEIVDYYGFRLDIESEPDKGTKVEILWGD